jgi:hypothetical protein
MYKERKINMNQKEKTVFKFAGHLFTLVATILFYNHLLIASLHDFTVTIHFNYFGEGTIELIIFLCCIPFIMFSFILELQEIKKLKKV